MENTKISYSLKEASDATSLSRRHLEYLIEEGRLAAVKVNRRIVIPAASLKRLVEAEASK
jgi:excisionase family DNA binding protein